MLLTQVQGVVLGMEGRNVEQQLLGLVYLLFEHRVEQLIRSFQTLRVLILVFKVFISLAQLINLIESVRCLVRVNDLKQVPSCSSHCVRKHLIHSSSIVLLFIVLLIYSE